MCASLSSCVGWLIGISLATDDSCFREEAGEDVAPSPLLLSAGKKQNQTKMTLKIRKCKFLQNRIPRLRGRAGSVWWLGELSRDLGSLCPDSC